MWKKGLLCDSTHESLLNTVIFYNKLYFTLCSGKEHRQLRYSPCQIQLIEQPGLRIYLQYTGDVSKNYPGGLRGQKSLQNVLSIILTPRDGLLLSSKKVQAAMPRNLTTLKYILPAAIALTNSYLLVQFSSSWAFQTRFNCGFTS